MNFYPKYTLFDKNCTYSLKGIAILSVILHHCYQHSIYKMGMPNYCPFIGGQLGSYAVALFFMLSGYGMFLSMRKNDLNNSYLFSHLKKLYIPFVVMYTIRLISFISLDIMDWSWKCIPKFLIMHYPLGENWFMKVIVSAYIISFFVLKYIKNDYIAILTIFGISCMYFNAAPHFGLGGFWYLTSLNFSLGMMLAKSKKIIQENSISTFFVVSLIFGCFFINGNLPICGSLISLLSIIAIRYVNINCRVFDYMGHHSWLFYLSHGMFLFIYPAVISHNWVYYPFFVLGATTCVVLLYNYVTHSILKVS